MHSQSSLSLGVFVVVISLVAIQRLFEMRLSSRNESHLKTLGAQEYSPGHFIWMKLLHLGWLAGMLLEVWFFDRPWHPAVAILAAVGLISGQLLRYAAILTLKHRWTVRIYVLPDSQRIQHGIFRWLRHPNYTGVVLEIAAVPLLHMAWITAITFTILNAWLLWIRIHAEERALARNSRPE
ncbi:MAG: hypothetical protein KDK39_14305 [Leptospiraceae bacterium]|nr:hypothetical protein [Leptospiraceae bacterium]